MVYVCIEVEWIYSNCISTVFIGLVFIANFIYLFIFIELDLIFLLFNTCIIKFIEGKFYFEGRACYCNGFEFVNNTSSSTTCFKYCISLDFRPSVMEVSSNAVSTLYPPLWLVGTG